MSKNVPNCYIMDHLLVTKQIIFIVLIKCVIFPSGTGTEWIIRFFTLGVQDSAPEQRT